MEKEALGFSSLPKAVQKGFRKIVEEEKPFMLAPINWAAGKTVGQEAVNKAYWNLMSPLFKTDMFLGSAAQKITPKRLRRALWEHKVVLPVGKGKGVRTGVEYSVPGITSPLKKAGPFGLAMLGTMKAEELLKGKQNE